MKVLLLLVGIAALGTSYSQLTGSETSVESGAPPGTVRLWDAFNPFINDHFFSTNKTEVQYLIDFYGYAEEPQRNFSYYIYGNPLPDTVPLFRLYSLGLSDHLYTTSTQERDLSIKRQGYTLEGTLGHIFTSNATDHVPLFRLHNGGVNDNYYTVSQGERERAFGSGYVDKGIVGYILSL